jgi:hypothetical protein
LVNSTQLAGLFGSGISLWGDPHRLEKKLQLLLEGKSLQVYYTGGSITGGHLVSPGFSYVDRVQAWFDKTYPGQTVHSERGHSATTSTWAAACIDTNVDQASLSRSTKVIQRGYHVRR